MNAQRTKNAGFTLVEVLVAAALIAMIGTMLYGSYMAVCRSSEIADRIGTDQQVQAVLEQIAGQLRCWYAPQALNDPGSTDKTEDILLQFATTKPGTTGSGPGLYDVAIRFDRPSHTLLISQSPLRPGSQTLSTKGRQWQPLLMGLQDVDLALFDGDKWQRTWDSPAPPAAIRFQVTLDGPNLRQYRTTAYPELAPRASSLTSMVADHGGQR